MGSKRTFDSEAIRRGALARAAHTARGKSRSLASVTEKLIKESEEWLRENEDVTRDSGTDSVFLWVSAGETLDTLADAGVPAEAAQAVLRIPATVRRLCPWAIEPESVWDLSLVETCLDAFRNERAGHYGDETSMALDINVRQPKGLKIGALKS